MYGRCTEMLGELEATQLARLHTNKGTCKTPTNHTAVQDQQPDFKEVQLSSERIGQSLDSDDGQKGPFSWFSLHQTGWLMKAGGFAMVGILGLVIAESQTRLVLRQTHRKQPESRKARITSKAFVATWQTAAKVAAMSGSTGDAAAMSGLAGDEDEGGVAASAVAWALAVATATAVVIRSCASCLNAHTTSSALGLCHEPSAVTFVLPNLYCASLYMHRCTYTAYTKTHNDASLRAD